MESKDWDYVCRVIGEIRVNLIAETLLVLFLGETSRSLHFMRKRNQSLIKKWDRMDSSMPVSMSCKLPALTLEIIRQTVTADETKPFGNDGRTTS